MYTMKAVEIKKILLFWKIALFLYVVDVSILNCIYFECIYACLLHVYREAFLPIVLWNKLLKLYNLRARLWNIVVSVSYVDRIENGYNTFHFKNRVQGYRLTG